MSTQLPYRLELDNRRAIVALMPELNDVPWAEIEKVGSDILGRLQSLNSPQLLVDLCALNYMGSAQVALVVRMFKMVKERNGKMVVANRDPMVLEVLSLAGLNKVWTIVESRERAMSLLGGGSMGSSGGISSGSSQANPLPGAFALIAVVIAAILTVIHVANPALIPSRGDLFGILGSSALAFLMGLWAMSAGSRGLGIGVILLSVGMLLYGVFEIAKPPTSSGSPAPSEDSSTADEAVGTDAAAPTANPVTPSGINPVTPPGIKPGIIDPAISPPAAPANTPPATKN